MSYNIPFSGTMPGMAVSGAMQMEGDFDMSGSYTMTGSMDMKGDMTISGSYYQTGSVNIMSGSSPQVYLYYNTANYATMEAAANGKLTITTIDSDAALGHIVLSPDGRVEVVGELSGSGNISGSSFYGDGSNLTNIIATTVTITDNESTSETNAIIFTSGGDIDGGNIGLESDGDLTYNPGLGLLKTTAFTASNGVYLGGKVGINTTSPKLALDVHYTGSGNPINLSSAGGGEVIYFGTGSTAPGKVHYLNTDGGWELTNANATGSVGIAGAGNASLLAIAGGTDPLAHGMLLRGWMDTPAIGGAWVTGSAIYVFSGSTAQSGLYVTSAPVASNAYVRVLGYCTNTPNVIYFNPDSTWVEIS